MAFTNLGLIGAVFAAWLFWHLTAPLRDPLRAIPGPLLARFTKLWCLRSCYNWQWNWDTIRLHRELGSKIVRYAPGEYSISDPEAIRAIHGYGAGFDKAEMYAASRPPTSLFNEPNNEVNGRLKKKFQATYSMSSVVSYEKGVAECAELLCRRLEERAGKEIDLTWWTHCFAWDSIGTVTFGKRFGFLDAGQDPGGLSNSVHGVAKYSMIMGQMPWLHPYFISFSMFLAKTFGWEASPVAFLVKFQQDTVEERRSERKSNPAAVQTEDGEATTFLDKFLDMNENDPSYFTNDDIAIGMGVNVIAGSDTTSAAIAVAMYNLIKSPKTMMKLRKEIEDSTLGGTAPITFKEAQAMPYLNAVITETHRMIPQTGFGLPRTVPAKGAQICGHFFPPGAVVNMNPWATHYDPANFGPDAADFNPDRWLTNDKEELAQMNRSYYPFGLGSRYCMGKNVAMLAMLKVIPELVRRFQFELSGRLKQGEEMGTVDYFVVLPKDMPVVATPRPSVKA